MKKRFLTLLLTLLAVLTLTVPAWAEQTPDDLLIYDTESLLTEEEWWELEMTADRISWQYNCAVYIVTIYDYEEYGGSVYEAAANIYNAQDFGIGQNRDGILLLMSMWDRSYALYVRNGGFAEKAVGKYAQTLLEDSFLDRFGENDWQGGFASYLATCEDFMARAEAGHPVKKPLMKVLPLALVIGCAVALAVCMALKLKMKSVRQGAEADTYVTADGLNLTERYDRYTHTTETRRKISKDDDSDSHSGGGGSGRSGHF